MSMTREQMEAELARLKAENEQIKAAASKAPNLSCKVGKAGGISVYGLGRFPVTLYRSQMERFLDHKEQILKFIEDNADKLKTKE